MQGIQKFLSNCADKIADNSFISAYYETFSLIYCDGEEARDKAFRLRHKVYCGEYGYECPTSEGSYLEMDDYDHHSAHFLLKHKVSNECAGTLRLVLPNPDNLKNSFSVQGFCDHPLLEMEDKMARVCEISRFCMAPRFRQRRHDGRFLSAYHRADGGGYIVDNVIFNRRRISYPQAALLQGAFETALKHGILDCLWMAEPKHLWSLQKIGFDYRILGPHLETHGGMQPLIFNIMHVLDAMKDQAPAVWEIISDQGRLHALADKVALEAWQDDLLDKDCLEQIYARLAN